MRAFRCLVTGSRTWDDEATVNRALDAVAFGAESAGYERLVVVHGAARGADSIADRWVREWPVAELTVTAERCPANWRDHGRRAGIVRNLEMLRSGPDVVLAFIRDDSAGATHCAELAGEAGIPLRVFHYGQPGVFALGLSEAVDG